MPGARGVRARGGAGAGVAAVAGASDAGTAARGRARRIRDGRGCGAAVARGAAMASGEGAGAGEAVWIAGCGGSVPARQAVNRASREAASWRRASQSRIASNTVPPACRTEATRVLRWPDAMWAKGIVAINVFLYNIRTVGKEKMQEGRYFMRMAFKAADGAATIRRSH